MSDFESEYPGSTPGFPARENKMFDFMEYECSCEVCGCSLGYGCFRDLNDKDICDTCEKAIKDAKEQVKYLKSLKK